MFWLLLACKGSAVDTATGEAAPQPVWPEWAFHHWVWEDESTQDSALELVHGYLDRDVPVGAIIIDSPWATGYSTFEWDTDRFPDPQGLIDELHGLDVRVMLWTVPGMNVEEALYTEASELGYFMQDSAESGPAVVSWWKGDGSLIDYFNPDAVDWWHGLVDKTLAYGIDGWKTDGLDFSALLADYSPGAGRSVERLEYSHAYYRDFYDYTRSELGDDRLISARPIDNYGADLGGDAVAFSPIDIGFGLWVGDQDATFDGLKAALNNFWWSADYGYLAFGSDIGGYRDEDEPEQGRTKELFLRWAGLGAFSPVMENGGGGLHHPWAWDDETVTIYRGLVELHMALVPYLMEQGAAAFAAGESLMTFESKEDYSYLLGNDVFVAPIIESGETREVTFPEGDWIWIFGGQAFSGEGTETLTVPLDSYPAFVRSGSEVAGTLGF